MLLSKAFPTTSAKDGGSTRSFRSKQSKAKSRGNEYLTRSGTLISDPTLSTCSISKDIMSSPPPPPPDPVSLDVVRPFF